LNRSINIQDVPGRRHSKAGAQRDIIRSNQNYAGIDPDQQQVNFPKIS